MTTQQRNLLQILLSYIMPLALLSVFAFKVLLSNRNENITRVIDRIDTTVYFIDSLEKTAKDIRDRIYRLEHDNDSMSMKLSTTEEDLQGISLFDRRKLVESEKARKRIVTIDTTIYNKKYRDTIIVDTIIKKVLVTDTITIEIIEMENKKRTNILNKLDR